MQSCTISDQDVLHGRQQLPKHMPAQLSVMLQRVHRAGRIQRQKSWEGVGITQRRNGSKSEEIGKTSKGGDWNGLVAFNQVGHVFKFYFILTKRTSELWRPRVICITSSINSGKTKHFWSQDILLISLTASVILQMSCQKTWKTFY